MPKTNYKTIIFIAGLGHSGSTFLQYVLATGLNTLGIGEAFQLNKKKNKSLSCSCKLSVSQCPFWKNITPNSTNPISFYQQILQQTGNIYPHTTFIIDSSKKIEGISPWLTLLKNREIANLKILYLVRDLRGWTLSDQKNRIRKKRKKRALFSAIREWEKSNKKNISNLKALKIEYQIISYEFLVFQFSNTLQNIHNFTNIEFQKKLDDVNEKYQNNVHDVLGNRMKNDLNKRDTIIYDHDWLFRRKINLLAMMKKSAWDFNKYIQTTYTK